MDIQEFINSLGLEVEGQITDDGCYVVELEDSEQFAKHLSILENNTDIEEDVDLTVMNSDLTDITYEDEEGLFSVTIIGDLENDSYRIVVKEG